VSYLSEYLNIPIVNTAASDSEIKTQTMKHKTNAELFHPYTKVAILNRGVIATKAIRILENARKKTYTCLLHYRRR
jgi:hypothetical protein